MLSFSRPLSEDDIRDVATQLQADLSSLVLRSLSFCLLSTSPTLRSGCNLSDDVLHAILHPARDDNIADVKSPASTKSTSAPSLGLMDLSRNCITNIGLDHILSWVIRSVTFLLHA